MEDFQIEKINKLVELISLTDDFQSANELCKKTKVFLEVSGLKESNYDLYLRYYSIMIKLKFIALNYLDDWKEIESLLSNHFDIMLNIDNYDAWRKLETNLLAISNLTERDEVKNNLKRALENSNCIIINVKKYKAIPDLPGKLQDWIKYINATLGTKKISNIEKISFFTHDKYAKTLDQKDKSKIRTLIDFYDNLKLSSREPAGFEASVPITIDEKLYIFDKGNLIPVSDNALKDHDISGPPRTAEEKTIDKLKEESGQYKEGGLEQLALKEEIERKKRIEDLKIAMGKYRADSLEAKVLKEEIDKLGRQ